MMVNYLLMISAFFSSLLFAQTQLNEKVLIRQPIAKFNQYQQSSFQLVGEASLSFLFWDIYKSKLLTTTGNYPINYLHDRLLYEIHYLTDISKKDLLKRTIEQWQHLGIPEQSYKIYIQQLEKIWPNIKQGDSLSLIVAHDGSAFYFNQQYIGTILTPEFGQIFLDIWLSKDTSEPKLRAQLLGEPPHG